MGHDFKSLPEHLQQAIREADGGQAVAKRTRRNKYNVSPASARTWRGRTYASKAECEFAKLLHTTAAPGTIIIEQPRVTLVEGFDYRPDFLKIIPWPGREFNVGFTDVKGRETQRFRDVCRLWRQHMQVPLLVVKRLRDGTFKTVKIISC